MSAVISHRELHLLWHAAETRKSAENFKFSVTSICSKFTYIVDASPEDGSEPIQGKNTLRMLSQQLVMAARDYHTQENHFLNNATCSDSLPCPHKRLHSKHTLLKHNLWGENLRCQLYIQMCTSMYSSNQTTVCVA